MSVSIYLDYAAATPVDPEVKSVMDPYFSEKFFNPSASYQLARDIKKDIKNSRESVAHWLGCKSAEIVFTGGVTESVNLAIKGVMNKHPNANLLVGSTEHDAVLKTASNFNHRLIMVDKLGVIDLVDLVNKIDDQTVLVSIMHANNETGTIQPLSAIAGAINKIRKDRNTRGIDLPLYLHSDAAQAANYLPLNVSRLGVDLYSLNGAKIYGPKQSAILYVKSGIELKSLIDGGGQERSLRGGTENVPAIVGFCKALDIAQSNREESAKYAEKLRKQFLHEIDAVKEIELNSSAKKTLPNIISIALKGGDGERAVMELDEKGIMVATGAACSASDGKPSHVLLAMGLSQKRAESTLRISIGRFTNEDQIKTAANAIKALVGQ